jgi:hypothetical protein
MEEVENGMMMQNTLPILSSMLPFELACLVIASRIRQYRTKLGDQGHFPLLGF